MANVKFSEFPSAATVGATDIIPILQGGVNKKATALIFSDYIGSAFVGLTGNQTVAGVKTFSSQLISTVAIGTAPFSVVSTTKVTNLNADLLDGLSSAAFQTVLTNPITGTGTTNYLPKFTGASALGDSIISDNGTIATIAGNTTILKNQNGITGLTAQNNNLTNGAGQGLSFNFDGATNLGGIFHTYNSALDAYNLSFNAWDGTSSLTRLFINGDNGNCGIGTTTPTQKLHLAIASASSLYTRIENANGNTYLGLNAGGDTILSADTAGNNLLLYTAATERMRITTAGNVLIGTTTDIASSKLTIESTTQGVLVPRMTTTQINAIGSPANGLIAYNTTLAVLCFYDGTGWRKVSHSSM